MNASEQPPDFDVTHARLSPAVELWGRRLLEPLSRYHDHCVLGLENIPSEGPVILAASHSLATYDGFMMGLAIYDTTGRLPTGLGDDLIFKIPGLRDLALGSNLYPASPETGERLLKGGHLLALAPGGMRESLRPSTERYQVRWDSRKGFVRLSVRTGAPIVLAATPAADDIFEVFESRVTKLAYKLLKVPVPLVRGRGFGLMPLPRRVKLTTWISEPIAPPPFNEQTFNEDVDAMHAHIVERMRALMAQT